MAKQALRLVDPETGELTACPGCFRRDEEIASLKTEKKGWITRYYNLARDKEAEARAHELWPQAVRLFEWWKFVTKHRKAKFGDRFWIVERFLRQEGYRDCERALIGLLRSDFHMKRGRHKDRDGSVFDEFERPFKSQAEFEKWRDSLPSPSQETTEFFAWMDQLPSR